MPVSDLTSTRSAWKSSSPKANSRRRRVVLVSRAFYDRYIYVRSAFLRGPGWDFKFIPRGDLMEIALNHEALPATAAEIRTAVELRWKAFRDAKPASVPRTGA